MSNPPMTTSRTTSPSRDWLKLGQTAGQRSAEIVAGIRAITFPSPEAIGLSSPAGRWFAQLLLRLNSDVAVANATGVRHTCLTHLAEKILEDREPPRVIVEMAAGFSARGYLLATKYPQAKVIEVDQPGVIHTKQDRLRRFLGDKVPSNLYWLSADLAATRLSDVVGEHAIDMVISEGVLPYFSPAEIIQIVSAVRASLMPNGILITDIVSGVGWAGVEAKSQFATWLLKRQVGQFKGAMHSADGTRNLFRQAGYPFTAVASLKAMAREYSMDVDVADVSYLVAAHNLDPSA